MFLEWYEVGGSKSIFNSKYQKQKISNRVKGTERGRHGAARRACTRTDGYWANISEEIIGLGAILGVRGGGEW